MSVPSHEVLKKVIGNAGVKSIAADMSLSSSLIYKWCQPSVSGGADNPIDRLEKICRLSDSKEPLEWLCEALDGYFVENRPIPELQKGSLIDGTQEVLGEFSSLLEVISRSTQDDGEISSSEARAIRKEWEDLKRIGESFVASCEQGHFRNEF